MGAARAIKEVEGRTFAGRRVAVAYNRHKCLARHPRRRGEHCYPVRLQPSSGSQVLGYADRLWLTDVSFFVSLSGVRRIQETKSRSVCCFVVGTVLKSRPRRPAARDWVKVEFDPFEKACFYEAATGRCLRGAKYVRLEKRETWAMGPEYGPPVASRRELNPRTYQVSLPVYNPQRGSWRGHMGGVNYERPTPEAVADELEVVWRNHPGSVVLDGTDDWFAPEHVRPELFPAYFAIRPVGLWHTGASGKSVSGLVLDAEEYELLDERYLEATGVRIEEVASERRAGSHSDCGCWDGSAFLVYRDPRVR